MKAMRLFALFAVLAVLAAPLVTGQAFSGTAVVSLGCNGGSGPTSSIFADRDNTGIGREAYRLVAEDGAGNVLYFFAGQVPLGGPYNVTSFSWSVAPQLNPITFYIISEAGNGFQEQVFAVITGECPGLPFKFSGPGLPSDKNLVLFLSDVSILSAPNGTATGLAIKTCQTAFVIGERDGFARLFVMGGWVPVSSYVDVPEEYGQPGFPVLPQCVGR